MGLRLSNQAIPRAVCSITLSPALTSIRLRPVPGQTTTFRDWWSWTLSKTITTKLMDKFLSLLVTAEKIPDWSERGDRFSPSLTGPGYLYVFVDKVNSQEDPTDRKRTIA